MPFDKPYLFKKTNTVVIEHPEGKHLRVKPGDLDTIDTEGGKGPFAQWQADPQDNGKKVRLKSLKTGKYLRIVAGGQRINVAGNGGKFTVFKVHQQSKGVVKFESNEFEGQYIAVKKNGAIKIGEGGPRCVMKIFRKTD